MKQRYSIMIPAGERARWVRRKLHCFYPEQAGTMNRFDRLSVREHATQGGYRIPEWILKRDIKRGLGFKVLGLQQP